MWTLFEIVELVRAQKLWTSHLNAAFESAVLEMTKAKNKSMAFLRTTLKATFYNETYLELAADLPHIREQLHGRNQDLYDYLTVQTGLKETSEQLKASEARFMAAVESWKPGASRLLDLLKYLPK